MIEKIMKKVKKERKENTEVGNKRKTKTPLKNV